MKLDDRPVIDQLLDPTPLNIVNDVLAAMCDKVYDGRDTLESDISDGFGVLVSLHDDHMGKAGVDAAADVVHGLIGDLAANESDRQLARISEFAAELEYRL